MKSRIISLGGAFDFFGVMKRVPNYSASFACMYSFSVIETVVGGGGGAVGPFGHIKLTSSAATVVAYVCMASLVL